MNKSIQLTCLLLLFFGLACSEKKAQSPPIPKEKMVEILRDIHLAEAALDIHKKDTAFLMHSIEEYYNDIFFKYDVSQEAFSEAFDYFIQQPDTLQSLYKKVDIALNALNDPKEQ